MPYYIIDDINSHSHEQKALLRKLEHIQHQCLYSHPDKGIAVLVSDVIDRGPKIRETLKLVKERAIPEMLKL